MAVQKPQSPLINWGHPLANGLVWNVTPNVNSRQDLVKRGAGTLYSSGTWSGNSLAGVNGFASSSTTNGGVSYPWSTQIETITTNFSLVILAKIDTTTSFSHLMCIPYSNTWSAPYASIHWFRDNTNNVMDISWANGGNFDACVSSATDFPTDGRPHVLGVTCNTNSGRAARFFKDGILTGTGSTVTGGAVDFGSKREVSLFNHNSADNGEGIVGQAYFAAIWNRQLTDTEMKAIALNPWQLYVTPNFTPYYVSPVAAAATSYQVTRMMMGMGM